MRDFIFAYKWLFKNAFGGKRRKAAPFNTAPLRPPGYSTFGELINRAIYSIAILGFIIGLSLAPFIVWASILAGFDPLLLPFFMALPAAVLLPVIFYQIRNYRLGYRGEAIVAEALAEYLRRPLSWQLFHSVQIPGGDGDIDHVLVGTRGVFCIETKAHRKAEKKKITLKGDKIFLGDEDITPYKETSKKKNPIKQARGNARALCYFLKDNGFEIEFVKAIVLYVDDNDDSFHYSDKGRFFVGKSSAIKKIFGKIKQEEEEIFSSEQVGAIGEVLAERNRVSAED